MQERDFKGVWIPKEVWLDRRLNALEKVILTEIDSLDSSERGCWASNKTLADFCQCSETKVSTAISKLIEYEYLYLQAFDGRVRELKSRVSKNERQDLKELKADIKNIKQSNIDNNIINNKKKVFTPPTLDEVRSYAIERKSLVDPVRFFEYFNAGCWVDAKGNKVKNWKQKFITWESHSVLNNDVKQNKPNFNSRKYEKGQLNKLFPSIDELEVV